MPFSKTVIINCAGKGTRLGFGHPKCLVDIHGEPLIGRQLRSLERVEDVRVVVGFDAARVIETVLKYRRDVIFVFNHEFERTNTLASLYLGSRRANPYVVSLDGDLLVHPIDFQEFLSLNCEAVAVGETISDEPVFVKTVVKNDVSYVTNFSRLERSSQEWTGLMQISSDKLEYNSGFVYQTLEKHLPIRSKLIRSREIDTIQDYQVALDWAGSIDWRLDN